jgi:hypothetical protein
MIEDFEIEGTITVLGKEYEVLPLEVEDLTEQNEDGHATFLTHEIVGFDEKVYVIVEEKDGTRGVTFGFRAFETDTGMMMVGVQDDDVVEICTHIVMEQLYKKYGEDTDE